MPAKEQKTKEAKLKAAMGSSRGRKKKWSKAKSHEKLNSMVLFDKKTYDKMLKDVPKMKLITPSIVSDRLKVNGSLARKAIAILLERGDVREIAHHNSQSIYTRATAGKA